MRKSVLWISSIAAVLTTSCERPRPVRSEPVYRAFKNIAGATAVGVTKVRYGELLQTASAELLILADFTRGTPDTLVFPHYFEALTKYKAAQTLWDSQIENARYDWIPRGQIYLEGDGNGIASRYDLKVTESKMPYSHATFKTVPSTSIQQMWELAGADMALGDSLVLLRLRDGR